MYSKPLAGRRLATNSDIDRHLQAILRGRGANLYGILDFPDFYLPSRRVEDFPRSYFPSRYDVSHVTPKDLKDFVPSADAASKQDDFRYKGFPDGSFERARDPLTLGGSVPRDNILLPYYPVKHWLDTRETDTNYSLPDRPLGNGSAKGFQYGSEGHPPNTRQQPRAIRDPFNERTSAELKKYRQIQSEVDEDFQKMKEDRALKARQRAEEQRQDAEQLRNYNPWGKPGHGAPMPLGNGDFRKKRLALEPDKPNDPRNMNSQIPGNSHRSENNYEQKLITGESGEMDEFLSHRGGGGAPLRTDSGRLKANLANDTSIRFQSTKDGPMIYDKEVRYKQSPRDKMQYRQELQMQREEAEQQRNNSRAENLRLDLQAVRQDPFGKPGAGAPNRHSAGPITRCKITLTTDTKKLSHNEKRDQSRGGNLMAAPYDPWGKGYGAPQRDQYGDTVRFRQAGKGGIYTRPDETPRDNSLNLETSRGGAGAPMRADDGFVKTRFPITMKRDDRGDASIREANAQNFNDDPEHAIYDPWGKGGGGAPMRDERGNIKSQVYGKMQQEGNIDSYLDPSAKHQQLREQQRVMEEQDHKRKQQDKDLKFGEGEFAAIIKQGKVGRPRRDDRGLITNQHLATTDVTQERTSEKKFKSSNSQDYFCELQKEATNRERKKQFDRLQEKQQSRKHQESMNDFWGRPGGGAPLPTGARKGPLDKLINSPRDVPVDFYSKNVQLGKQPYNYVRNTTESTSNNHYDFNPNFRRAQPAHNQGRNYNLNAPWANSDQEEVF